MEGTSLTDTLPEQDKERVDRLLGAEDESRRSWHGKGSVWRMLRGLRESGKTMGYLDKESEKNG